MWILKHTGQMSSDNKDKYSNYTPLHAQKHGRLQASHQGLWKGKDSSQVSKGTWPRPKSWFRLLTSRIMTPYTSVVLIHPACGPEGSLGTLILVRGKWRCIWKASSKVEGRFFYVSICQEHLSKQNKSWVLQYLRSTDWSWVWILSFSCVTLFPHF